VAGPIKISVLADVGQAVKEVTRFSDVAEEQTHRVITGMGDPKLTGSFGKWQEGFDVLDTRAMGFRDTVTGVQDSIAGFSALMGQGAHANDNMYDKLVLAGTGVGDLASGMTNFLIPLAAVATSLQAVGLSSIKATVSLGAQKVATVAGTAATGIATAAQWAWNVALSANPIGLVIIAVIALVGGLVLLWKKSETFRAIVTGAFNAVWGAIQTGWHWVQANWPLLLAILTGPIGLAVRWIVQHWDQIVSTARAIPGKIKAVFSGAGSLLKDIGKRLVQGLIDGVLDMFGPVRGAFSQLTNLIPSWKGPESRDRRLLRGPARAIIGGFAEDLRSAFPAVAGAMADLTGSIGGTSGRIEIGASTPPVWAQRLIALLEAGLTLTLESSGRAGDDALLDLIAERVRVRGGTGKALGITRLA
jgi:phage-related protein